MANCGILDSLELVPLRRRAPKAGEIEVRVHAAAINFRDVLRALGMIGSDNSDKLAGDSFCPGFECAGTVAAVGERVTEFRTGDKVMLIINEQEGCLASYVTVSTEEAVYMPAGLSFAEAATIPVAFATAFYGLHTLAGMQSGERVLIHSAAGGVGQAAVQLAQAAGAEILATASSSKWPTLQRQGIRHIFSSRTPDFADKIRAVTDGPVLNKGVDIVLNSLSGDFIEQSFAVMARGGRFIEIGKLGIRTEDEVRTHRPDARYFCYQLGEEMQVSVKTLLEEISAMFEKDILNPLPCKTFPVRKIRDAFRYMQQAKHIGKVVITFDPHQDQAVRSDSAYLVTGGLGGLGLTVARTLVEQGARCLVLSGRSGLASDSVRQAVADLEHKGAEVKIVKGDVSDRADAKRLVDACSDMAPLRGIIHAAGVLDDGVLLQQTANQYAYVAAPKVSGAWNLHTLTRRMPLDFFVLFSSTASLMGGAGQANYAAANSFLDSLARERTSEGLPGLSINWGAWSEKGMAARTDNRAWLEKDGMQMLTPEQGSQIFKQLLHTQGQVGVIPINWHRFAQTLNTGTEPFCSELLPQKDTLPAAKTTDTLRGEISRAKGTVRRKILESYVQRQISRVLGREDLIPLNEGFFDLGMDSLMAVELRNLLQQSLECSLTGTFTFDYPTGSAMVAYLMKEVLTDLFTGETTEEKTGESAGNRQRDQEDDVDYIVRQLTDELGIKEL